MPLGADAGQGIRLLVAGTFLFAVPGWFVGVLSRRPGRAIALLAGAWFSWLAVLSGGLFLAVLGHALVNAAGFADIHRPETVQALAPYSPTAWIGGVFLVVAGAALLRRAPPLGPRPTLTMVGP